jgi:multicomponent Na+:H+ antiporter subunit A
MELLVAVLASFVLGSLAPVLHRVLRGASGWMLALLPAGLTAYFAQFILDERLLAGQSIRQSQPWLDGLDIHLAFVLDGLSLLFALLICGVGTLVVIYAGGYLAGHRHQGRFFWYLLSFMGSMLGLVLSDNLITLFVFWELTSFTSYLLIGFDHQREAARRAALQALLVTGGGGLALLAGFLLLSSVAGTMSLSELPRAFESDLVVGHALYPAMLLLILAGAMTKSAQFPFHFWLPNAMEAPTPVSAYLHSSTMVKAGVYLLARLHPALGGTTEWIAIVATTGAVTMLLGAYLSLRETYLKRILAYSTVSVLGVLVLLLGLGGEMAIKAAMVFLLAHALYKGGLFLVAGTIDHETGQRDVERLGGLGRSMPITCLAGLLAALSMAGIVPMFGFVAKEALFYATWPLSLEEFQRLAHAALVDPSAASPSELAAFWQVVVVTGAAVIASIWLVAAAALVGIKPFFGRRQETPKKPHEAPPSLWLGPLLLAAGGVAAGVLPTLAPEPYLPALLHTSAAAVIGDARIEPVDLGLFHGLTPALVFDLVAIGGGASLFFLRRRLAGAFAKLDPLGRIGPARGYDLALGGLNDLAAIQTRILQNGYLRFYITTILLTAFVLGLAAVDMGWPDWPELAAKLRSAVENAHAPGGLRGLTHIAFFEIGLAVLILAAAGAAIHSRSRLAAIASLGVVGYSVGLVFVIYGAPDLAMTQLVVESLMVVVFVLAFYHLPPFYHFSDRPARLRDLLLAGTAGAGMTILVLVANQIKPAKQADELMAVQYAARSVPEAHGRNIVNVILVDFRALDTLGEITVLAVAGLGVYALLRLRLGKQRSDVT